MKNRNLELVREAIKDWQNGKLKDGPALFAIAIAVTPQRKPTAKIIKLARIIEAKLNRNHKP